MFLKAQSKALNILKGMNQMCNVTEDIKNTTVWGTHWSWYDVIEALHPTYKAKFNSLSPEKQKEIVEKYNHSIAKGLEGGIMSDWFVVMKSAIDWSGVANAIEQEHDLQEQILHGRSE